MLDVDFNVTVFCARCRAMVRHVEVWMDHNDVTHVRAQCHGATEKRSLSPLQEHAMIRQLTMFRMFTPLSPALVRDDEQPMPEDDF